VSIGLAPRHNVPTHLDEPDGVGRFSTRQLLILTSGLLFMAPAAAWSVPPVGPAIGDILRALMPTLAAVIEPGTLPIVQVLVFLLVMAAAVVLALPLQPPAEHGAISYLKYRTRARILGSPAIDVLIGEPRVDRNVAHVHGQLVALWEMPSVSMRLASESARSVERAKWAAFLDVLPCPIATIVRATPVDLSSTFKAMEQHPHPNGAKTAGWLRANTAAGGEIMRRRFIAIRSSDAVQLARWATDVEGALTRATFRARRLEGDDLADALHLGYTRRPRIGPSRVTVEGDALQVDTEWVTTSALQRWPTAVTVDFAANFYDGQDAIDVVQIITPQDTLAIRRQLEDRKFRLETTSQKRSRNVALEQLDLTLESLERNTERVFDVTVLMSARTTTHAAAQDAQRRIQTIAGEMGGQAAALRWEHTDGIVALAGTLEDRLVKRDHLVDSTSLSSLFPWGASELGLPNAVPWGVTLHGKRRVVWTPYARPIIPNPNIAVYATSGGGKGFAIKVWSARAMLAGILAEAFFMDQAEETEDGEYGRWATYLGGEIRKLHRHTWEADLAHAIADIPAGTLPPVVTLNVAELDRFERCRAMVAMKRAVFERAAAMRRPRAFGLDEMWTYADDTEAAREGEDVVRRGRHFLMNGWFATQRALDALNTDFGRTVQSICATRLYGMQNPLELTEVAQRLRWTSEQVEAISRFGSGDFLMEAGLHRVAFTVDYTPEEWEMANTD
jgi:hypothetical protein